MRICLPLVCALFCALISGCAGNGKLAIFPGQSEADDLSPSPLIINDPAGPIPEPELPPDMLESPTVVPPSDPVDPEADTEKTPPRPGISYRLVVTSPDRDLADTFEGASLLARLDDQPPTTLTGLEQRLRSDVEDAYKALHSHGYYAGKVTTSVTETLSSPRRERGQTGLGFIRPVGDGADSSYQVEFVFEPGPQYTVGRTAVLLTDYEQVPDSPPGTRKLPVTLADVGLAVGDAAEANAVLEAVERVRRAFRDRGYPFALITSTRYIVDHNRQELEAEVRLTAGPFARMGPLVIRGETNVLPDYLESQRTWRTGQVWNQWRMDRYYEKLRESGLFQSIVINPSEVENQDGLRDITIQTEPALERTVGGAIKYNSDFGAGVQAYWEHRNITDRGDKLRIELPIWEDLQRLTFQYRLPFFLRDDQDFLANAALRHEITDAYEMQSGAASVGIERRFSRRWRGTAQVSVEGGELKDPDEPRRSYWMVGLPLSVTHDQTNSLLDASKGFRATLSSAPYYGEYDGEFTALRSRLEAAAFLPLVENELVLALKGVVGTVTGPSSHKMPASIRFYSGGGGSVRGYAYQSLGPRNDNQDPLGGASVAEVSVEARWKITDEWGVVAFVDGGTAYESATPTFGEDMRWGAGLGLRYYTVIGPIRLDLATPLNPRRDDDPFQIYLSIGQNF